MIDSSTPPPAGWYPDPAGGDGQRYWDGRTWGAEVLAPCTASAMEGFDPEKPKKGLLRPRNIAVAGAVGLAAVFGVAAISGGSGGGAVSPPAEPAAQEQELESRASLVEIPNVVGMNVADATATLEAAGLKLASAAGGTDWIVVSQDQGQAEKGQIVRVSAEAPKPALTLAQENALEAAQSYLDFTSFSRAGLIRQLSSEYGEGYDLETATWAADNVGADWMAEAVESAKSYLDLTSFSRDGLYEQLTSEHGEGFTPEEANHALAAVGY